jgi:hypothetical protein
MAESAFDNFRSELIKRLGLRLDGKGSQTRVDPTPTPTPDISGIYANKSGSLEIKLVPKGLTFALTVGNGRCAGEISGGAKWINSSHAVYRARIEKEAYEDPSGLYYQKMCQLTFSFLDKRVDVAQTEGCDYYHGAECDFNGTYRR